MLRSPVRFTANSVTQNSQEIGCFVVLVLGLSLTVRIKGTANEETRRYQDLLGSLGILFVARRSLLPLLCPAFFHQHR
jgi:hypothetical protein